VDDLWFDARRQRVYASCAEGFLVVVQQEKGDKYRLTAKMPTVGQAKTCLYDSDRGCLYIGVPKQGENQIEHPI
jgi:hypothetical protein